jgi:hypothetical protein
VIAGAVIGGLVVAVAFSDELRRKHEQLIRDAIQLSKMSMLRASQEAEIDHAQFRRQVEMLEGSHKRLAMQPVEFWQWYAVAIAQAFGLPDAVTQGSRLGRMAKMALPTAEHAERVS